MRENPSRQSATKGFREPITQFMRENPHCHSDTEGL